jgi:N-methylhydantoinase A
VRVGVDVGGTFTDIVLEMPDGRLSVSKTPSTPHDPGAAVVTGLAELLRTAGVAPAAVAEIVHGTTVASNTILQQKGARVGLLTTRGFRDVLEIGRVRTPDLFDLTWQKPTPLVARRLRLEVDERIAADGAVVRPLDAEGLLAAAERLIGLGAQVIATCFINSYVNPAHEEAAERLIRARHPSLDVTASCRVLPEIKEYERTSTTVVNAYLLPVMRRYLADLAGGLTRVGIEAPLPWWPRTAAWPARWPSPSGRRSRWARDRRRACRARPASGAPSASRTSSCSTWAAPPPRRRWWRTGGCRSRPSTSSATASARRAASSRRVATC